jgi:hypothetical protein
MSKVELYLVKSSYGEWDDYREDVEPLVYATIQAAEKKKQEIVDHNKEKPFPLDWCTQKEFLELSYEGKITDEDSEIYDEWESENSLSKEFNRAWIYPVELHLQSWRERHLEDLI